MKVFHFFVLQYNTNRRKVYGNGSEHYKDFTKNFYCLIARDLHNKFSVIPKYTI